MPLKIIQKDITLMKVDAIVNAANHTLLGGGGVDGCIHRKAGADLLEECRTLGGCNTGEAKITGAYNLPSKYVIHTVGPVYEGGQRGERELLYSCYKASLEIASKKGLSSVAFPLISSGVYGYPKREAFEVATQAITDFLRENDMLVYIVIFDKSSFEVPSELFENVKSYIDTHLDVCDMCCRDECLFLTKQVQCASVSMGVNEDDVPEELVQRLKEKDESFSKMLLRKIDEKGIKDSECYKKANVDRKLFSKIRTDANYRPGKATVLAFAISLELSLDETSEMLMKAGFAFSHSRVSDLIVEYFISNGIYDVFKINEVLFKYDQTLLGV